MEANADKCHLLTSPTDPTTIKIKSNEILNSDSEKLQDMIIYSKLSFNNHLQNICKKANQKVHVITRTTPYLSIPKWKLQMNFFLTSQFNCYRLVWMCHSRLMNHKINLLPKKRLRVIYSDNTSPFEELLDKDGSATMHSRNLHVTATEMFKVYKNLLATTVAEIFRARHNNYSLKHSSFFPILYVKTVYHGSESLSNLRPRI